MEWLKDLGPSAAVVLVVYWGMTKAGEIAAMFTNFLSNHLALNTKAMQDVCVIIAELRVAIQTCHDYQSRIEKKEEGK
jgi:hypothetical protein